ncbi:MAG: kynureninase [Acidobacteria bacterium OLB17]|nr:MAG: kynureninase [Acidobacteria bacterium OLB17]MCZ2391278.1 kynureninase [Acidobacteriota bacterium]
MNNLDEKIHLAASLDESDPLRHFRERFLIPKAADGRECVYFTGNSLGLQPRTTRAYIEAELDDWARLGVEGHLHAEHPWLPYHEFLTEKMASVIGARPIEAVVMNSLTVNLHLMLVSFYRPDGRRRKIIIEKGAFPSDRYASLSHLQFHGIEPEALIELAPREGETTLRTDDILRTIDENAAELALVLLGGVNYYTGQAFDLASITTAGHNAGAVVGFDLAHAAGNLELHLHDWQVDLAVWCSYKYLNAGPGGIAGAFVHERHSRSFDLPRFAGWWGHDKETRFLMGPNFSPLAGAEGWQISNPPIFQLAALRASLDIFDEAGMPALRRKSLKLTGYLESLIAEIDDERIEVITPTDPDQRGCQLSIRVRDAELDLFDRISASGVVADWREPDVIRVAPVPLYNSFDDVGRFARILSDLIR